MSDNSWYENGELPPVGSVCCYIKNYKEKDERCYDEWIDGDKLEVLCHKIVNGLSVPIVFNIRHETASGMQAKYLRPIKTERELAINEMSMLFHSAGYGEINDLAFGAIYDAGYRKNES